MRFSELKNKELVCSKNGLKIGFVDDVELDAENYRITHLIAYGKGRLFGLLGKYDDLRISCELIQVIGDDIILVCDYEQTANIKIKKEHAFFHLFE